MSVCASQCSGGADGVRVYAEGKRYVQKTLGSPPKKAVVACERARIRTNGILLEISCKHVSGIKTALPLISITLLATYSFHGLAASRQLHFVKEGTALYFVLFIR